MVRFFRAFVRRQKYLARTLAYSERSPRRVFFLAFASVAGSCSGIGSVTTGADTVGVNASASTNAALSSGDKEGAGSAAVLPDEEDHFDTSGAFEEPAGPSPVP